MSKNNGWIGVDLDGTLARYSGWVGPTNIGEPIPEMINRVRKWVAEGKTVKIFTARVACFEPYRSEVIKAIHEWLEKHGLPRLDVTNVKDMMMVELWDDRAIQVEINTGKAAQIYEPMSLNEYQSSSWNDGYPREGYFGIMYCALKLNGEAGEVAEKVGKTIRDHDGDFNEDRRAAISLELGDTLWYVSAAAKELGYTLEEIAAKNIGKIRSRQARGTMHGEGDNR